LGEAKNRTDQTVWNGDGIVPDSFLLFGGAVKIFSATLVLFDSKMKGAQKKSR
jgi:hypothetical protein